MECAEPGQAKARQIALMQGGGKLCMEKLPVHFLQVTHRNGKRLSLKIRRVLPVNRVNVDPLMFINEGITLKVMLIGEGSESQSCKLHFVEKTLTFGPFPKKRGLFLQASIFLCMIQVGLKSLAHNISSLHQQNSQCRFNSPIAGPMPLFGRRK